MAKGRKTGGRRPGSVNKVTAEFRDVISSLLEANRDNYKTWLADVAQNDPGKALDLVSKLAEYAAPKLARMEHTGKDGGAIVVKAATGDEAL